MINLKQIFDWFTVGYYPTAQQFKDTFSSFWHKSEKLPIEQIVGLQEEIAKATTNFKGYHLSLADLQTAYPQAANKKDFLAWVGSPYPGTVWKVYANGGAWTNTGEIPTQEKVDLTEYAKKVDINNIKPEQLYGSEASKSNNIVPTLSFTDGKYKFKDGKEGTLATYSYSGYIDVTGFSGIIISEVPENGGCFYNASKTYLSGFGFTTLQKDVTIPVPEGAKYAIVNLPIAARQAGTASIILVRENGIEEGKYTLDWLVLKPEQVPATDLVFEETVATTGKNFLLRSTVAITNLFPEFDKGSLSNSLYSVTKNANTTLNFSAYNNEITGYTYTNVLKSTNSSAANKYEYHTLQNTGGNIGVVFWVKKTDYSTNNLIAVHFYDGGTKFINMRIPLVAGTNTTYSGVGLTGYCEVTREVSGWCLIRAYCSSSNSKIGFITYHANGATQGNGISGEIGANVVGREYSRVGFQFINKASLIDIDNTQTEPMFFEISESDFKKSLAITENVPTEYYALGDSIVIGQGATTPYAKLVADKFNMALTNLGVGGMQATGTAGMITKVNLVPDKFKGLVTISIGINDAYYKIAPIGDPVAVLAKPFETLSITASFAEAFRLCLETLLRKAPDAIVYVILPIKALTVDDASYTEPYREVERQICKYFSIPFSELHTRCTLSEVNYLTLMPDGVHPNDLGHSRIARVLINELKMLF